SWRYKSRCLFIGIRSAGYLDYSLTHQNADGWLGPRPGEKRAASDVWSQALALKMLLVYHDAIGNERVFGAVDHRISQDRLKPVLLQIFTWNHPPLLPLLGTIAL
ncbi:MAG: hypothetical protein KDE31_18955, partial [Caldilineaceae bacterium]|nr:hypothetical protein [Caldilineaceae bacterium]